MIYKKRYIDRKRYFFAYTYNVYAIGERKYRV
jgi:hypothetical protein